MRLALACLLLCAPAYARWFEAESKRRRKKLDKFLADAPARPPWIAVDAHGIVLARDFWIEPWWGGYHKTLIRRLRGW